MNNENVVEISILMTKSLMDLREIAKSLHIKNIIKYKKKELAEEIYKVATSPEQGLDASKKVPEGTVSGKKGHERPGRKRKLPSSDVTSDLSSKKVGPTQPLERNTDGDARMSVVEKSQKNETESANRNPVEETGRVRKRIRIGFYFLACKYKMFTAEIYSVCMCVCVCAS